MSEQFPPRRPPTRAETMAARRPPRRTGRGRQGRTDDRPSSRNRILVRRCIAGVLVVLIGFLIWLGISLGSALTNPSLGASPMSRFAEWGRAHGIGPAVTWLEKEWYALHPPKKGGAPGQGSFNAKGRTDLPGVSKSCPNALPMPPRMVSPVIPALPGEGVWQPAGRPVAKCSAMFVTSVRPDTVHTSYTTGIAWMDPRLLRATLYSGSQIPGGSNFKYSAPVTASQAMSLVSAFNAGFRMGDSQGGYYTDHKTIAPLVTGKASAVVYKDGTMDVGAWGTQVTMNPNVVSVRQNLDLIVNNGHMVPGLDSNDQSKWGATLGGTALVWRSGFGVTANGGLVYVGGPSLSITALADLLQRAGCVRAMEFDMNVDWVNYVYFNQAVGQPASAANGQLLVNTATEQMTGGTSRYFANWWTRDFYTMNARYAANATSMNNPLPG